MDVEASDKPKFCVGDDDRREPIYCEDFESDDDIPLSQKMPWISNLGMCSSKPDASVKMDTTTLSVKKSKVSPTLYDRNEEHDDDKDDIPLSKRLSLLPSLVTCSTKRDSSVKKSDTTTVAFKRLFDNSKSLCGSMKKPKVSPTPYDDNDDGDDDVPISSIIKMPVMLTDKLFSSLKKELASLESSFEECKRMRQEEEKRLQYIKRDIEKFSEELRNKKTQVSCVRKINEIYKKMKGKLEAKEGRLCLMDDLIGERKQELKTKQIELRQVMDNISKQKRFETQVKEFESREKKFKRKVKEMVKDMVSMQAHFDRQMKDHESKVREFDTQVKELESKKKHFKSQVEKHFGCRLEEFESKKERLKELDSKEKQFEGNVKELESNLNKFDGQLKEPELRWIQYEALMKYINEEKESVASYMHDQSSRTIDETSLQLDTSEKTDVVESLCNDILVFLLESSDPSRLVLDMIQNPIIPLCKDRDNGVIIANYHIYLLEQLMRISPNIEPCVREEALKLALDLKAYMKENTENSATVLAFLLLLSIYGLLTSFNEDEVIELFAFVAQHKIAIELFGTLGFANRVSDFVENLIRRKQFVGAVRFSFAYNLAGKKQLVDLLRQHVQNAKLICESSCENTSSIEIKDIARDQEIACLGTVLQCILDNNCLVESEDWLNQEIQQRILELNAHKGK